MYHRMYLADRREGQPEGFAVMHCDQAECRAAVAVPFTEADRHPMALATEASVAAGWQLYGADDRCPAHLRPAAVSPSANVAVEVPARHVRVGDVARVSGRLGVVADVEPDFHHEAGDAYTRIVAVCSGVRTRRVLLSTAGVLTYPARRMNETGDEVTA